MKPSSGTLWFLRVFVCVVALVFTVGYYGHVRAQSGTGSVRVPLRPLAPLSSRSPLPELWPSPSGPTTEAARSRIEVSRSSAHDLTGKIRAPRRERYLSVYTTLNRCSPGQA